MSSEKKIDFSVIMPVRGNINGLRVCLGAFQLFTARKEALEVLLVVDDDDPDVEFYDGLVGRYGFDLFVHKVKRSDNFCRDYYNAHVKFSRGTNILVYNDDCYMQTNGWDEIVRHKIEQNKQFRGIYLVDMMDSTHDDTVSFPKFPMISRKACDVLGFFFFPQVRQWPADKCIWDLYKGVGCVITCHEVKMQHDHNYAHMTDPSKSRMLRILEEDKANGVFPIHADKQANALREYITMWKDRPDWESAQCGKNC